MVKKYNNLELAGFLKEPLNNSAKFSLGGLNFSDAIDNLF